MTTLIDFQDFATSRYADMADQVDNIESIINQAEAHIQSKLSRVFAVVEYEETYDIKGKKIFVSQRPIVEVSEINIREYYLDAWTELDVADFRVDNDAGVITSLADEIASFEVQVIYTAGYENVPDDIKAAVILQTVVLSFQDFEVYGAGDGKEPAINHLQKQIDALLAPYRKSAVF